MNSLFSDTKIAFQRKSNWQLRKAIVLFKLIQYPIISSVGKAAIKFSLALRLPIGLVLKPTIFDQFVGGEDLKSCQKTIDQLFEPYKVGSILDYAVEGNNTEKSFEKAKEKIIDTIQLASVKEAIPFSVFKLSALLSFDELQSADRISRKGMGRINQIICATKEKSVPILIDAEESWIQDQIDRIALSKMTETNRDKAIVFNTLQCYRKDALSRLRKWSEQSQEKHYKLGIKLVRGAYLEKERETAALTGIESPVCDSKSDTDAVFDECLQYCLMHLDHIEVIVASHNENSFEKMMTLVNRLGLDPSDPRIFTAQLYGMSDHLTFNLIHYKYNTVKYVPFGPLRKVLPYLFRRADENTSVMGQSTRELSLLTSELRRRKAISS